MNRAVDRYSFVTEIPLLPCETAEQLDTLLSEWLGAVFIDGEGEPYLFTYCGRQYARTGFESVIAACDFQLWRKNLP